MIRGRVWKYGDDVNTDRIFPGRYTYILLSEAEMGQHALEDLDERFTKEAQPGDIIVAGNNWGGGSAREQSVKALTARGIAAIVAKGFSRIYFRNGLNEGLPVIVCPEAVDAVEAGETIEIDLEGHRIVTPRGTFSFAPYDPFIRRMLEAGGLISQVRQELRAAGRIP